MSDILDLLNKRYADEFDIKKHGRYYNNPKISQYLHRAVQNPVMKQSSSPEDFAAMLYGEDWKHY